MSTTQISDPMGLRAMLANAQWLAKNAPTAKERASAARQVDAILSMAATMLDRAS